MKPEDVLLTPVITPKVYNTTSKMCVCGCGETLSLIPGTIQLFKSGHRKEGRSRGRHKKFYDFGNKK